MSEYIEREALLHRTKAVAANVIFRGCEEMVSPKDSCNPREWTKGYEHGMKESLNLIATQGAADVVPVVHGRWRVKFPLRECGCCGEIYSELGGNGGKGWYYCPNCGCRMDGGNE